MLSHAARPRIRQRLVKSLGGWQLLVDDRYTKLRWVAISRLVVKIKNASRKAKPFGTLLVGPGAVAFRQQLYEPFNKKIDPRL